MPSIYKKKNIHPTSKATNDYMQYWPTKK